MKITILCSSTEHPIYSQLLEFCALNRAEHEIEVHQKISEANGGDILFLVAFSQILNFEERSKYQKTVVLHNSKVPLGRGWSPHVWQILEGKTKLYVTILEAQDQVDTGDIWCQTMVTIPKTALHNEINDAIFKAGIQLMQEVIETFESINPVAQDSTIDASYYPKRTPTDSILNINKSIAEQFDLIRVSDPDRYPAQFQIHGKTFKLLVEHYEQNSDD